MAEPQAAPPAHHANIIPPAIKRQAERAEQLQRESVGQPVNPGITDAPPSPAPSVPPDKPATAAPAPSPPAPQLPPDVATVQGRLDAEREVSQQLRGQVASLERMVSEVQQQMRVAQQAPVPTKFVTPEQEADFGADMLEAAGNKAREIYEAKIAQLENKLNSLEGAVGNVGSRVVRRERGDMLSELARVVPNWHQMNSDQAFIQWLQLPEPYSGIKRHDLLMQGYELQDADRVIRFFTSYLNEAAATGQNFQPVSNTVPPQGANGKIPLETFAAPGRAAPAPASAPQGDRNLYTRAQISQFFTDKAAGRWRGRETDAANIEADIFRAGPEGRVIG